MAQSQSQPLLSMHDTGSSNDNGGEDENEEGRENKDEEDDEKDEDEEGNDDDAHDEDGDEGDEDAADDDEDYADDDEDDADDDEVFDSTQSKKRQRSTKPGTGKGGTNAKKSQRRAKEAQRVSVYRFLVSTTPMPQYCI